MVFPSSPMKDAKLEDNFFIKREIKIKKPNRNPGYY